MIGPEIPANFLSTPADSDDSSDSDVVGPSIGPQIPIAGLSSVGARTRSEDEQVGPQIPPGLLEQRSNEQQQEEEEDDDDYTPALPPELLVQRSQPPNPSTSKPGISSPSSTTASVSSSRVPRRPIGPSLPSSNPQYPNIVDSDDDEVGPKPLPPELLPMHEKDAITEFLEREERRRKNEEKAKEPKALKREEWMLVPPSASDLLGNLDTTKLKARQFSRSTGPVNKSFDNSLWTETPAERQKRLADEVAGKKRRAVDVANEEALGISGSKSDRKRSKREEEDIRRGVDEYTQKLRGPSLVEQHTSRKGDDNENDDDDTQNVIWDHSRDMALGGRLMDDSKRSQLIREAKGLGDRFSSGKGGSFL